MAQSSSEKTKQPLNPMVFTFEEMPKREPMLEQKQRFFTLEEMPESARRETPPENPTNLSDHYAVAQNPNAPANLPLDAPFAARSVPNNDQHQESLNKPDYSNSTNANDGASNGMPTPKSTEGFSSTFRREFLTGGQTNSSHNPSQDSEFSTENLHSRAPRIGSFSLDTYEWDFAPYMGRLGKQIQRNIYPPPAFTFMGIISGRTTLRFRISRDGTLLGMELLGYEGHKSLMEASVRAVQLAASFQPLPDDFPKDYLEITAHFEYTVRK
jgi:outer membrane biosynthesis protein TonB